jgi:histidinol dehydrogenase
MRIIELTEEARTNILENLLKRSPNSYGEFEGRVNEIIENVRANRDAAIFDYTKRFDGADINAENILVTEDEIKEAYEKVDEKLLTVIRKALVNIRKYHEKQRQYSWFDSEESGIILGQKVTALEKVGVYVPGGKAVYPSSVLMNIVPAKVAGVKTIVMTTPPGKDGKVNPATLVAAKEAGVDAIYKVGGAQAIAALAFGTESVPKVDKIVGPGNIYVALAKKAVFGFVSIDSIAGPSEIMVLADETANPHFVAADLLSQAEHDEMASAILVTTSRDLAEQVSKEVEGFVAQLSRKEIIQKSLDNYGYILVAESMDEAIATVNEIASEHLELVTKNPFETMTKIRNAGAIFVGEYSSEPLGDYFAGPNHVLPTNGTAKFFSPLSVDDFIKKSSIISYSREALEPIYKDIVQFAECEQ